MLSPREIPGKESTGSQAAKMKETTNQERSRTTNESITNSVAGNNNSGAPATK